jgi:hypothetical protein
VVPESVKWGHSLYHGAVVKIKNIVTAVLGQRPHSGDIPGKQVQPLAPEIKQKSNGGQPGRDFNQHSHAGKMEIRCLRQSSWF